jgi:uncharacterized protein (DUF1778 family)
MTARGIHDTTHPARAGRQARTRSARLEARITAEQKDLLSRAAALVGRSLSDFVVASAYETATRTVREHEEITLSDRDRKAFVSALLNAPAPGSRLRNAARRYRQRAGD